MQKLEGKIEEISCQDLVHRTSDVYFLILQKLKEKAKEMEILIEKSKDITDIEGGQKQLGELERELIKVIPSMNLVRKLLVLTNLYKEGDREVLREATLINQTILSSQEKYLNKPLQSGV